ncbi:MAG: hypothetical protein L0213_10810 [Candidatus Dadabacteria bacterium]|nr:hypothetical protein [Candidatus Dadabacteria bacterium]
MGEAPSPWNIALRVRIPRRLIFSAGEMKMLREHECGPIARRVLGTG